VEERALAQPFGRGVDQPVASARHVLNGRGQLRPVQAAVDGDGLRGQGVGQTIHLIFHQRDEGGDDESHALVQKGGQLVAEGFARAGG
jgi:hypothetical protein